MNVLFISVGSFDRFGQGQEWGQKNPWFFIYPAENPVCVARWLIWRQQLWLVLSEDSLGLLVELWLCREAAGMCEPVFLWAHRKLRRRHSVVKNTQRGLSRQVGMGRESIWQTSYSNSHSICSVAQHPDLILASTQCQPDWAWGCWAWLGTYKQSLVAFSGNAGEGAGYASRFPLQKGQFDCVPHRTP